MASRFSQQTALETPRKILDQHPKNFDISGLNALLCGAVIALLDWSLPRHLA
jgi:hypothetical protein